MGKASLLGYVAKRVVIYLVTFFVAFSVFFFMHSIPGDPLSRYVGTIEFNYSYRIELTQEIVDAYKERFGLEGDLLTQHFSHMRRVFLEFDFGPSFLAFPTPARDLIWRRLPFGHSGS